MEDLLWLACFFVFEIGCLWVVSHRLCSLGPRVTFLFRNNASAEEMGGRLLPVTVASQTSSHRYLCGET